MGRITILIFNYGYHEFWEPYDPTYETGPGAPAFGPQKVTFDGANRLIIVNTNEIDISVGEDIYSNWKEWVEVRDNSKFLFAITAIGGDPITDVANVGITYFLENGWRVQPLAGDYILTIDGNIYTREPGDDPVNAAVVGINEESNITVNLTRSNLVDIVQTSGSTLTTRESAMLDELWKFAGLDANNPLVVDSTTTTAGADINQTVVKVVDTVTVTRSNSDPVPGA